MSIIFGALSHQCVGYNSLRMVVDFASSLPGFPPTIMRLYNLNLLYQNK